MALVAIAAGLDQHRARAVSYVLDHLLALFAHRDHVHAVHHVSRHAVALGFAVDLIESRGDPHVRRDSIEVVLDQEDHRKLPELGHVERLVEDALVRGAIAQKRHHHPILVAHLDAQREPDREREVSAHDGVAAHEVALRVTEVHGAALPLADAGRAPIELGHQRPRAGLAYKRVGMIAVGPELVLVVIERTDRPRRHGLLADVEVREAADEALGVRLRHALFETSNERHIAVELQLIRERDGHVLLPPPRRLGGARQTTNSASSRLRATR